jgi:predicted DCC family thiol-disulfide oxidoreductase YuxK
MRHCLQSHRSLQIRRYLSSQVVQSSSSSQTNNAGRNSTSNVLLFPEQLNIIYDSKCGICKLEMDMLERRDIRLNGTGSTRKLRLTDIENENYDPTNPMNGGVTYARGMAAIHAVLPNGTVIEGIPVFVKAYDIVELGWLFRFMEWSIMKPIVNWGYTIFAKYRTIVTRGVTLQELIKEYDDKKKKLTCDGDSCNNYFKR